MDKALLSFIIVFGVSILLMPLIIKFVVKLKAGQPILHYVDMHKQKSGTPTMGGIVFLIGGILSYIIFYNPDSLLSLATMSCLLGYGVIGFLDDFIKVRFKDNQGLRAYQKIIGQVGIAILMGCFVYFSGLIGGDIIIPFTGFEINIGIFIIPFVVFVFLATTNAVNLTDGLDGLAGGVSFVMILAFMIVLNIHIANLEFAGENPKLIAELYSLLQLIGGVAGVVLAFLCFNCNPAKIFMGDTGSLALGGFIASMLVVTKFYLLLPIIGIMFVLSTLSVVIQVGVYKLKQKRVFLMAPLHHHFEKKGCYENKIVAIYIVITIIMSVIVVLLSI